MRQVGRWADGCRGLVSSFSIWNSSYTRGMAWVLGGGVVKKNVSYVLDVAL